MHRWHITVTILIALTAVGSYSQSNDDESDAVCTPAFDVALQVPPSVKRLCDRDACLCNAPWSGPNCEQRAETLAPGLIHITTPYYTNIVASHRYTTTHDYTTSNASTASTTGREQRPNTRANTFADARAAASSTAVQRRRTRLRVLERSMQGTARHLHSRLVCL